METLLVGITAEYEWNVENQNKTYEYDILPKETLDKAKKVLDSFKRYMEIK